VANPSIKDVADSAGVSVGTVSNVLNHPDRVSPTTLAEVNRIIGELGYVRNDAARQLRAGQSTTVGMIIPDITNPFFTGVLRGVETAAAAIDLDLIVGDSDDSEQRQGSYIDLFEKQRVRGLLVSPVGTLPDRLSAMSGRGTPVVLVDHDGTDAGLSCVSVDDIAGGYMATKHLLEAGARRIAFLAGNFAYQQVADRLQGSELAVSEYPGAQLEVIRAANHSALAGREAAEGISRRPKERIPEGIFAVNDMLALGVLQTFMGSRGIRVPDDVLLVGYDDIEFSQAAITPLSSVRQAASVMGHTALILLQEQMMNQDAAPRRVTFEPELIVRASSTPSR
jgi:LacI family transcriptional regulator